FVDRAPEIAGDRVLVLPISSGTQIVGALVAGLSRHLRLSADYRDFFDLAAARISAAITNARAYEEERRRAEALAELDRAKTTFFSNVSHEFRTPLTLMIGPIEDLLQASGGDADREVVAALELAHRNGLRLLKLVNTLLDFSRLEAGRIDASYQPVDLAALTSHLASVFRSAMEKAGLRLIVQCEPLPEPVHVDPDMWEKIVLNLLSNAFKFTFEGTVTVALRWRGDRVELSVSDTGIGIPAAELPRVFERFHRVSQARGRTHEGTGIGLALVYELAKLHGGTVTARSDEGRGSEFVVAIRTGTEHLPPERLTSARERTSTRVAAHAFVEEALRWLPGAADAPAGFSNDGMPEPHRPAPAGSPRPRVLVADDNGDMRDYVARILGQAYRVETVKDGQAALERIQDDPPALVLADVMMPNMDGFDLLRAIRADARSRSLPVILLSARAGEEARIEGLNAGADEYLVKPFSARELLARVSSQIELTRVRREGAAAQGHLAAIVDSAEDAIISKDLDGIIQWCNGAAERLFGYPAGELVGRPVRMLIPADRQSEEDDILARLRRGERVEHFETVRLRKDGRPIDVALTISPVRDASGTIIGASKIARDIAAIKRAEAERLRLLEEASRLKDEFLASLSHELRTPLNAIVGYARMLRSGIVPADRQPNAVETIERNATSLTQMVEDVLDVSRIVSGKIRLNVQSVDVPAIVAHAIEGVVPAADAKGVRVERVLDPHATPIAGDPERLQQILWNLLTNAVKFTPRGGKVQVRLERIESQVAVTVSDTGIGIPREFLPHVFERFRQADGGITRERGGLGLGLSIARQLAEMHGGTIDVESAGPGQGATFRLKIPLMIVQPARSEQSRPGQVARPHAMAGGDLRALHVLAVDDDRDALALLTEVLESAGARVTVASSAQEALGKLDGDIPNVIIADLGMPRMDGFQLIERIRQHADARVRSVPAAALTAYARSEDRTKALRAGFQIHLAKPIDPAELVTTVASLARRFA
ncbi:MAG TPA: ATP-binding protein, partial [Vicinamibacterales bacterium]|nr:ATP-binding protein [Vicinamibacterales bacterium]